MATWDDVRELALSHPGVEQGLSRGNTVWRAIVRFGPVRETVRVAHVVDEPRRRGLAYGTLREHPLRGEEAVLVEWRDDDAVELVIRAFSRPNGVRWWLLAPVLAIARRVFRRRYLRALVD